ncbi:MAG: radical SAM protein [Candidatus Cloacimonetes bacterium]|nr:radical SAM protein [Candidatus Cloacimonadota bacterium]
MMIEPTSNCNLACPLCPSGNKSLQRERSYIDLTLYKKVINEIKDTAIMLLLWNQGEPLLHKDLPEMIRYAKDHGLFTMTSTNLNYLPNPDALVDSGLDSLIVSLDGATQKTYNKYRVNGDFQKVLDNTTKLVEAKRRKKSPTPYISWQFIIMRHNEHEIPEIKKLAEESQVDELIFKTVQIYEKEDIDNFLPTNDKYRRYKITEDGFILKKKIANRCRRIFTQPVVNCDGELAICCYDKDNVYKVGNLKDNSIKNLWKSSKMNRWREIILKERNKMGICLNCGEGINLKIKE